MRETLEIFFQRQGWDVTTCAGGVEAFDRLVADSPFEIVITDLVMPEVDGIEVLKEVKKRDSSTQVVVITAYARTEDAVRAMKLGAYDYIQKPFSMEELLQTTENAVEKCRLLRENIRLRKTVSGKYQFANIIGESEPLRQVFANRASAWCTGCTRRGYWGRARSPRTACTWTGVKWRSWPRRARGSRTSRDRT